MSEPTLTPEPVPAPPNPPPAPPKAPRRLRRAAYSVAVIVAILAVLWAGGWFWLAGFAESRADQVLAEAAQRGVTVACSERRVTGFPFALRITCGPTIVNERSGAKAAMAGVSGGASVFAPMTARVSLVAPLDVEAPGLASPTRFLFDDAGIDVGVGMAGARDVAFDATNLSTTIALAGFPEQAVMAQQAAGTVAPSPGGGTQLASTFTGLAVTSGGIAYPPVSGRAAGELSVPPRQLASGALVAPGQPLTVRAIDVLLDSNGARLGLDGDIAIDADGILDGAITLTVAGADALPEFIRALPPQWQNLGNAVAGGLFAFGQPATLDGEQASALTIRIERGAARVGPVEFNLPRVRLPGSE